MSNRRLKVGHTGITWRNPDEEQGIKCISKLGFDYIEVFARVMKAFHDQGRADICKEYNIPLISCYYSGNLIDPSLKEEEITRLSELADITAGMGAKFATFGGSAIIRKDFNFNENKKYMVEFINHVAQIFNDKGIRLCFHPHTGTAVETEAEIRSFMDAVDTKYVGFAPDIGQIQKGGSDALKVTKDYLSIINLVHFKDFCGKVEFDEEGKEIDQSGFACYCPLGQGVVDLKGILDLMEDYQDFKGPIMVELDGTSRMTMSAEEAVTINKEYMEKQGYNFVKR